MRPVNQLPLSLTEMKRSPLASSHRHADSPPKPGKPEVSTSPLRYSSAPKRRREWSLVSKEGIGRALTSIGAGAVTECSSSAARFGGWVASCARALPGSAASESPAAAKFRKRRRVLGARMLSRMQSAAAARRGGRRAVGLAEQFGKLLGDGAAELFGVDNRDGAAVVAGDVVADADRDQFDRRAGLDFLDDVAQMALQIIAGIDRQRGIVDRRAVGNHHQDLAA